MAKYFEPRVRISNKTYNVRTFGATNVALQPPVSLPIHIYGIKIPHLFYFVDADAPALVGYDLMRVARLVIDVHNRLVWLDATIGHVVALLRLLRVLTFLLLLRILLFSRV